MMKQRNNGYHSEILDLELNSVTDRLGLSPLGKDMSIFLIGGGIVAFIK